MAEKCHICMESITINMLYSNAFRYNYESRSYSFHHICLEDLANTKNENKSLKLELNCMKEVYNALIQRHSIVEESLEIGMQRNVRKKRFKILVKKDFLSKNSKNYLQFIKPQNAI